VIQLTTITGLKMFKFELDQPVYTPSMDYPSKGRVIGRSEFINGEPSYLVSIDCHGSAYWLNESLLENIYKHPDFATYKAL
jgi:hypothetical protein